MTRPTFSTKDRARIFTLYGGICHLCEGRIDATREKFDIDHVTEWFLTRDNSDENLRPAHKACHKTKSAERLTVLAKVKRQEAKHHGFKEKKPWSPFRKRMDGRVERREP